MSSFQPDGWHTVTPRIITSRAEELVRFVKEVFRGEGEFQMNRPAKIRVGDSLIMISDGGGLREPMPAFLYVYVEDLDETCRRAVKAGRRRLSFPQTFRTVIVERW